MRAAPVLALVGVCATLALHVDSRAEVAGPVYDIPAQVIAGGGGRSTGGRFTLDGTIAQSAVGPPAAGGAYVLIPGFHRQRAPPVDGVFADGFEAP